MIQKRVLFILMVISIGGFLWLAQEQQNFERGTMGSIAHAQPGHQAPDFNAETFTNDRFQLNGAGKNGTVLYFWTSWCPYCQASSEAMEEAYQTYGEDINIIGVNAGQHDRLSEAEQFIERNELHFTNVLDEDGAISSAYYVPPVPTTVFIDEQGIMTYRKTGAISSSELTTEIQALLKGDS
ncbi:TlpA family protein disulfide reductase [Salipaludibacillus daqingensis]|uniref:TlpA family protein disulfide reductase n=1 Tax=Salipaludibacillus daqingensis TaxID=3041001 RepID=UPI00247515C6|nr:TlpA disulfide reductase family protein [Salipaludibacillus daqingensis]